MSCLGIAILNNGRNKHQITVIITYLAMQNYLIDHTVEHRNTIKNIIQYFT